MEKFVKFCQDIWKRDDRAPNTLQMKSVSEPLREKATNVKGFNIAKEIFEKETKKRKNWNAPVIDGIQNFLWSKIKPTRRTLNREFE